MSVKPADNPSLVNCASHGTAKSIASGGNIDFFKFKTTAPNKTIRIRIGHAKGTLYWGDGDSQTYEFVNDFYINHTYVTPGEYVISFSNEFSRDGVSNKHLTFELINIPWEESPIVNWSAFRHVGSRAGDANGNSGIFDATNCYLTGELDQTMGTTSGGSMIRFKVKHTGYKLTGKWPPNLTAKNLLISRNDFVGPPPPVNPRQVHYQINGNGFRGALPTTFHTNCTTIQADSMHDDNPQGKFFFGKGKTMLTFTIGPSTLSSNTDLKTLKLGAGQYYRQFRNKVTIDGIPLFSSTQKLKTITLNHCGLSEEEASNFLIGLKNRGITNGSVNVQGNNGLNVAGIEAKNTLVSRGWTVIT
jgi:hypothetical protein